MHSTIQLFRFIIVGVFILLVFLRGIHSHGERARRGAARRLQAALNQLAGGASLRRRARFDFGASQLAAAAAVVRRFGRASSFKLRAAAAAVFLRKQIRFNICRTAEKVNDARSSRANGQSIESN